MVLDTSALLAILLSEPESPAEAWQVGATGVKDYLTPEGIRVGPALPFLQRLV